MIVGAAIVEIRIHARHDRRGRPRLLQQPRKIAIEQLEDLGNGVSSQGERVYFVTFEGCEMPMRILVETIESKPFAGFRIIAGRADAKGRAAAGAQGSQFDSECQAMPLAGPEGCHGRSVAGVGASGPIANAMFPKQAGRSPIGQGGRGWLGGATPRCRCRHRRRACRHPRRR